MPPKAMYLFRMAKGTVPKGGKVKFFDQVYHQRDPNKFGEIEVRRAGQQFVAFGDHPETNQQQNLVKKYSSDRSRCHRGRRSRHEEAKAGLKR